MSEEKLVISKETFEAMDVKSQNGVIYDYVTDIHARIGLVEKCIQDNKLKNVAIAIISGLVAGSGGTLAIGKLLITISPK